MKTIEIISWNSRKKRFDFGMVECNTTTPELQMLDGVRCFSCHKNKGPILGQGWRGRPSSVLIAKFVLLWGELGANFAI